MPELIINRYWTKAAMQTAKKEFEKRGYKCFAETHVYKNQFGGRYTEYYLRAEKKEG